MQRTWWSRELGWIMLGILVAVVFVLLSRSAEQKRVAEKAEKETQRAQVEAQPPVKVTEEHMAYMEETVLAALREEATLYSDVPGAGGTDFAVDKCHKVGTGKAKCSITPTTRRASAASRPTTRRSASTRQTRAVGRARA